MNKSKRKQQSKKQEKKTGRQRQVEAPGSPLESVLKWGLSALLCARFLFPTEAAVQGDSLWVVQLWLGLGLIWAWNCHLSRNYSLRFELIDFVLWILVAGHVVSALAVLFTTGDKRAALNMMWEWVGLGVGFFLLRQIVRTGADCRKILISLVAVSGVLAGLGLWQHYVSIPQTAMTVGEQMEELTNLENQAADLQAAHRPVPFRIVQRIQELQRELRSLPQEEPARTLYLKRLRSTEPFGLFALANSFAGLLLPVFFLAAGLVMGVRRTNSPRTFFVTAVLIVLLIVFCLLLTKSRTAWVSLAAGLFTWGLLRLRRGESLALKQKLVWGLSIFLILVGFFAVAGLSSGFDREVFSEAPKSARYRLQYWTGAWQVIREFPVLGTGPGNFRQHYLKYKLPESSEEIADPHNLILDVWTSGGIIAVTGLLAFCIVGIQALVTRDSAGSNGIVGDVQETSFNPNARETGASTRTVLRMSDPLIVGAASSFVVVPCSVWLLGGDFDLRLLPLFIGFVILTALLSRTLRSIPFPAGCLAGACVALLVHLLGAGGIEMPAISQIVFTLIALGMVRSSSQDEKDSNDPASHLVERVQRNKLRVVLTVGGLCAVLFGLCFAYSLLPVLKRTALVRLGDVSWIEDGNFGKAMVFYKDAAEADPFSPKPLERRAELSFQRWKSLPAASDLDFESVVQFSKLAINLDPHNSRSYRVLGLKYLKKFERTANSSDADLAVQYLSQAIQRYPHNAGLRAESAEALFKSGRPPQARQQAEMALRLDEINRNEGHTDKYLPNEVRKSMQNISKNHLPEKSSLNRN